MTNENPSPLDIAELAQRAAVKPQILTIQSPDGIVATIAALPTVTEEGRTTVELRSLANFFSDERTHPKARKGTARLNEIESFIEHVNRFKDDDSAIFAETNAGGPPSLTAVIDYHKAGATGQPRFGQHRAFYPFPLSKEWIAWNATNGSPMTQQAFAEFIEENLLDVAEPAPENLTAAARAFAEKCGMTFATPAKLLELSRGLQVNVEETVLQATSLASGERQIQFSEKHTGADGAPIKVPGAFLITIPVFRGDDAYQICVRLRYRKQAQGLVWLYEMFKATDVFDHAIEMACQKVANETGLPVFKGSHEK
jgi:uncharacterized protein YfdQ (DUF2303 family)